MADEETDEVIGEPLGQLIKANIREHWKNEAGDFTPWLAREENLKILSTVLEMRLELISREEPVGSFRADIVCRDLYSEPDAEPDAEPDVLVLIENQLESTDHKHLGQILTYASGVHAETIIWIAGKFRDEHRSALDWLNAKTDKSVRFFGLEIELWRIDNSRAAPRFNIVSKPNEWSRKIARSVHWENRNAQKNKEYWAAFLREFEKSGDLFKGDRTPGGYPSLNFKIDGFLLRSIISRRKNEIRAALYVPKAIFSLLQNQRDEIENNFGCSLVWNDGGLTEDSEKNRLIVSRYPDIDPDDKKSWPEQHEWLTKKLNSMHRAFSDHLSKLNATDGNSVDKDDLSDSAQGY